MHKGHEVVKKITKESCTKGQKLQKQWSGIQEQLIQLYKANQVEAERIYYDVKSGKWSRQVAN